MTSTTSQGPVVVGYQDHDSDDALEWACQEAARRGAPVRVLHAYAREQLYPWGYGYPLPVGDLASVEGKMRTRASTLLEEATERARTRHPELPLTATPTRSTTSIALTAATGTASLRTKARSRATKHISRNSMPTPTNTSRSTEILLVAPSASWPAMTRLASERKDTDAYHSVWSRTPAAREDPTTTATGTRAPRASPMPARRGTRAAPGSPTPASSRWSRSRSARRSPGCSASGRWRRHCSGRTWCCRGSRR